MERKNQGELFGRPNTVSGPVNSRRMSSPGGFWREGVGLEQENGGGESLKVQHVPQRGAGEQSERGLDVRASLKAFEQVVQNQVSGTAVPGEGKPSLQWSGPPRVSGRTSHTRDPGRRI